MTIASGVATGILALSACAPETYEYEVSGTVQAQQVDYDCPGEDVALDAVAFVARTGGTSGGKGSRSSNSGSGSSSSDSDSGSSKNSGSSNSGGSSSGSSGSSSSKGSSPATKAPKNKGVTLSKKPKKAEKLKGKKTPKVKYKFKPKGCETEYEIFVLADDGSLYEQDVRKVDYDKCEAAERKLFPLCTEG